MTTSMLRTVLALAERNNLPAIWKRIGRSTGGLEFEIGQLTLGDRQDLGVVEHYIKGDGKAKACHAVKALGDILHRLDVREANAHNRISGEPSLREPLLAEQLMDKHIRTQQERLAAMREHERLVKLADALAARVAFHLGSDDDELRGPDCQSDAELRNEIREFKLMLAELERPSRVVQRRAA